MAIVSEDIAAQTWPDKNPLGRRLKMGAPDSDSPWYTVVGVAAATRYRELTKRRPTLYLPAAQFQMTARMLVVRTTLPEARVAAAARDVIRSVDRDAGVVRVASFRTLLDVPLARPRFNAVLLMLFGVAAVSLAGIGLYAVVAAYVRQRDRETAIRLALGATVTNVRRSVLLDALGLAFAGVLAGLAAAVLAIRGLSGLVFGIQPIDPVSLTGAAALLLAVSLFAAGIPAWRATHGDPMARLRAE